MSDPRELLLPSSGGAERCDGNVSAVVVGGGIAGVSAAAVLAERGVSVTLLEREAYLGGRAGAWTERLPEGAPYEMERGFHAFFRQYYNLKRLLQRIDPGLGMLVPLDDYPILGPGGQVQTFSGLPRRTPYNVIALTSRTPTIGLRDFRRIHARRAMEMVTFDMDKTYEVAAYFLDIAHRHPPPDRARRHHQHPCPEHGLEAATTQQTHQRQSAAARHQNSEDLEPEAAARRNQIGATDDSHRGQRPPQKTDRRLETNSFEMKRQLVLVELDAGWHGASV